MAPHVMHSGRTSPIGGPLTVRRRGVGRRSAALRAASQILRKTKRPARVYRSRPVQKPTKTSKSVEKPTGKSVAVTSASYKKRALMADAIFRAMGIDPRMTRSRRASVSSVESGSSDSSTSSRSSGVSTGSRPSMSLRSADVVLTKTKLRPRKPIKRLGSSQKKPVKAVRAPAKSLEKVCREKVSDDEFLLKDMNWSAWKPAMAPVAMDLKNEWTDRRGERSGVRNIDLFKNNSDRPAVYEFAVQPEDNGKKFPVLFRVTNGFSGCHWDSKLLNGLSVEAQIDRVLKRRCKLFVRRAPFSRPITTKKGGHVTAVNELRSLIQKTYDYPWQEHYDTERRKYFHRNVTASGVKISDNAKSWKF